MKNGAMRKRCLTILLVLLTAASAVASEEGTTFSIPQKTLLFGAGYTNQYDSYLSPIEYGGAQLDLLYARERCLHGKKRSNTSHLSHQSLFNMQLHTSTNDVNAVRLLGADLHYDAGWFYNWWHVGTPQLSMRLGGQLGTTVGGIYSTRASNNPANAHAAVRTAASFGAKYQLPLKRTKLAFSYQADIPLIGAAFSPDFGQSYYELSQHGYCHNICMTSPFSGFTTRQLALIDILLKRSSLTFGCKVDIRQAKLNHLRQHQYGTSFMIGWTRRL